MWNQIVYRVFRTLSNNIDGTFLINTSNIAKSFVVEFWQSPKYASDLQNKGCKTLGKAFV